MSIASILLKTPKHLIPTAQPERRGRSPKISDEWAASLYRVRKTGVTWSEVVKWARANGIDAGDSTIQNAVRRHQATIRG